MIKNKRQRQQAQKQIDGFRHAVQSFKAEQVPEGVHPRMHQATLEGYKSILSTLEREANEFDALASGRVQSIAVENLDGLPEGLIKARIAKGLTQKELANRLGVTQQQVQRWEFEDYENVGFARLVDIAHALQVNVSETIELNGSSVRSSLEALGIDRNFLSKRLAPANDNGSSLQNQVISAAGRLSRIFGIDLSPSGEVSHVGSLALAGSSLRFKLPLNGDATRTRAYAAYVEYLCKNVAQAVEGGPEPSTVPRDWRSLAALLFKNERINFETALKSAWELGVPVLPLSDPIRFHGCCYRVKSRNIVVLKQSVRQPSRWLFDLVHELYHAGESPRELALSGVGDDPTAAVRRESDDESAANEFAGNVLLSGRASDLYDAVLDHAQHVPARLKKAAIFVAEKQGVDVGILANYVAFRLKSDQIDWWGTATNLQPEGPDPFLLAKQMLLDRADFTKLNDDDRSLVMQALDETIN